MRARWTNICLSKLLCICPSLLEISTKKDRASTEISYQFLAPKVSLLFWGGIKPPTPVLQLIHFQLQRKALYYASVNSSCAQPPPPPPPPPPRATAGHLFALLVPGVGHLQILGCSGRTLSFWRARGFLSEYNRIFLEILLDFIGKTSRLAHLSRTGKNWRTL